MTGAKDKMNGYKLQEFKYGGINKRMVKKCRKLREAVGEEFGMQK